MLLDTIKEQVTTSVKSGDKDTALTLRSIIATLHNEKIKKGEALTDDEVIKSLKTEVKKRDEAFDAYEKAGRKESAANEKREKELITTFMPKQLNQKEIEVIIDDVISGARDKTNFGLLMRSVLEKTGTAADGGIVSVLLKKKI